MQKFSADTFYSIGYLVCEMYGLSAAGIKAVHTPEEHEKHIVRLHGILEGIEMNCAAIGLKYSIKEIKRAQTSITQSSSDDQVQIAFNTIDKRITDEMEDQLFMYIPATRAERYDKEEAFGADVARNFPSASFDIREAGNCFAGARSTACVFHLMRALELGLVTFAKLFNVPSEHDNWHNIIQRIESAIGDMGKDPNKQDGWKDKQEQYSQAAHSFMIFKGAWRNYTAHARGKFTEDEADAIYRNVRAFMQKLAEMGLSE